MTDNAPHYRPKHIVVISGGMDSVTMLYGVMKEFGDIHDVECISFDYGQRHRKELEAAKAVCESLRLRHDVIDISNLCGFLSNSALTGGEPVPHGHYADENMKKTVVPNRNMIMLSIAMGVAVNRNASKVWIGVHAGDHAIYPDCRPEFIGAMHDIGQIANYQRVDVMAPYLFITKGDIAKHGKELGVDYGLTWTCYEGGEHPCGLCGSCVERAEAFEQNGMTDPLIERKDRS